MHQKPIYKVGNESYNSFVLSVWKYFTNHIERYLEVRPKNKSQARSCVLRLFETKIVWRIIIEKKIWCTLIEWGPGSMDIHRYNDIKTDQRRN